MRKLIFIISLLVLASCSEKIDLTGKFDVALNNEVMAVITLKQNGASIVGLFDWNDRYGPNEIYTVSGKCVPHSREKTLRVTLTVKSEAGDQYLLSGTASDSDTILGSLTQLPNAIRKFEKIILPLVLIRKDLSK